MQTGQITCYDTLGREISCSGSKQDAEFKKGVLCPIPRFEQKREVVSVRLTGLIWAQIFICFFFFALSGVGAEMIKK